MTTQIKYLSNIPEDKVEETLQKWIDDGWHWWPQTYCARPYGENVFWSFILSKDITELEDKIREAEMVWQKAE